MTSLWELFTPSLVSDENFLFLQSSAVRMCVCAALPCVNAASVVPQVCCRWRGTGSCSSWPTGRSPPWSRQSFLWSTWPSVTWAWPWPCSRSLSHQPTLTCEWPPTFLRAPSHIGYVSVPSSHIMRSRGTSRDGKTGTKGNRGILLRKAQMKLLNPFLWVFFYCSVLFWFIYLFIFTTVHIIACIMAILSVTSGHDWFASSQFRPWASIKDALPWRWRLLRLLAPIVSTERKSYQRVLSNNVTECHTERTPLTGGWTSLSLAEMEF